MSSSHPSSGGFERIQKRSNTGGNGNYGPPAASSSSSSYYPPPPRSDTPPASSYFPLLAADQNGDSAGLRPIPDAGSHFAYSTTLRRHHPEGNPAEELVHVVEAEAVSLWAKVVSHITGQPTPVQEDEETPHRQAEANRNTASARFAHCSAEVCDCFLFES